jgi:predicted RND superfamily exporter protein
MTVTVASLVIGAGIDFGIHITHRFREQHYDRGLPLEESIETTVRHVGRALIAGGLTTAGVFGILGVSTMVPLRHFGWTTAVGLIFCLLGSLLVLPSLLVLLSRASDRIRAKKAPEAAKSPVAT